MSVASEERIRIAVDLLRRIRILEQQVSADADTIERLKDQSSALRAEVRKRDDQREQVADLCRTIGTQNFEIHRLKRSVVCFHCEAQLPFHLASCPVVNPT